MLRAGETAVACVLLQLLLWHVAAAAARVGDVSTTRPIGVAPLYGKAGLIPPLCW